MKKLCMDFSTLKIFILLERQRERERDRDSEIAPVCFLTPHVSASARQTWAS